MVFLRSGQMPDLPEPDFGDVWDGYHRHREYEEAEHLLTQEHRRADTLIEHRPARPDPKPAKREPRRTGRTDQLWRWKLAVLERDQGCCVHLNPADCREGWQAHHVVAQQELRRTRPDALWNPLSGMGVCGLAHRQHHSRVRPILLNDVPPKVVEFLCGLGFGAYLERRYL